MSVGASFEMKRPVIPVAIEFRKWAGLEAAQFALARRPSAIFITDPPRRLTQSQVLQLMVAIPFICEERPAEHPSERVLRRFITHQPRRR
jgi:hypothetical protein